MPKSTGLGYTRDIEAVHKSRLDINIIFMGLKGTSIEPLIVLVKVLHQMNSE